MTDAPLSSWVLAFLAALALAAGVALFAGREAKVSRDVILFFVVRIALPMLMLLGLPLALLAVSLGAGDRVLQALVAGLVIAMGWLTSAILAEVTRSRDRQERLRDYHRALYAEIANNLTTLWNTDAIETYAEGIKDRMRANADFVPFIPKEHNDHVYDAVIDRIEVLPRATIDAIVAYYSQIKAISALAEDMRGDAFRQLSQDRRIAIYVDYVEMKKQAYAFGVFAVELIRAYADGGTAGADRVSAAVNTPAEGPSDRSRGSE